MSSGKRDRKKHRRLSKAAQERLVRAGEALLLGQGCDTCLYNVASAHLRGVPPSPARHYCVGFDKIRMTTPVERDLDPLGWCARWRERGWMGGHQ